MNIKEKIIIKLNFPQFNSPSSSRFESLFLILKKTVGNKKKNISYKICPERIISGEDNRTSLIIKNIPKSLNKKEIREMIEQFGNINFLRIIQDKTTNNFIIAYLNVINYKSVVPIFMGLRKHVFNYNNKVVLNELYYSQYQGKEELKKYVK